MQRPVIDVLVAAARDSGTAFNDGEKSLSLPIVIDFMRGSGRMALNLLTVFEAEQVRLESAGG